ncbi:DNA replication and repair protein RecF [termite gut metagenome]|uniref:DNA replication and repair protein RecF n=1 Tax=termite gut metagenome TaxID=433724 RepID=A0A5J4RXG5_9ZZZZ
MEQIKLINYSCFSDLTVEFKPGINLLIGDNASGKTTVLRALCSAMSSFFVGYSDENTRFIGIGNNDFAQYATDDDSIVNEKPVTIQFLSSEYTDNLEDMMPGSINELKREGKKNRTQTKGIGSYKSYSKKLYKALFDSDTKKQTSSLPLFAAFSTKEIHSKHKPDKKLFKQYYQKPSFGYYECMQGNIFFPYWIKRLLVLAEGDKAIKEVEGVRKALQKALGNGGCNIITDMSVRPNQGKVYYHFTDGREVEAENLSDGYRRLVNMVTDLAFRCMLLNKGIYGSDACECTCGTVLIDEIDLHLHPSLQSVVLKGLQRAFPKLQFIVTTHAPMVMSGIEPKKENMVYQLSYMQEKGYQMFPVQTYGLDVSTIMEMILGLIPRTKEIQEKLNRLFNHIDDDQYQEAKDLLDDMREQFGENLPELAKATAMLNFLKDSGNEED